MYAKENSTKFSILAEVTDAAKTGKIDGKIDYEKLEKVIKLAQDLDQINSQYYPFLFTTFLGLNSNPTNETNREHFWETVKQLTTSIDEVRKLEIEKKGVLKQ